MGAFVLFLLFIYINENIAITPNDVTYPLNIKSDVSPADLPIRRYKEEYYDPIQDIYSETQYKKFLDDPYRFYDDISDSERFYTEHPMQSIKYNEYRTLQRNPEIAPENCFQSRINYNDFSPQDELPYREMENAETTKWCDREEFLKCRTKEYDVDDFSKDVAKIKRNPDQFYVRNKYISDYYGSSDKPKHNENKIAHAEDDASLKLPDNYFMQNPFKSEYTSDNAYTPNIFPKDEKVFKKYSEFSERIPLDNVYNRQINQKPGNFLGNYKNIEADEFKDKTHLKHSLTSSASAIENRLLTSHIKRTFDKVKGEEESIPERPLNDIHSWKSPSNEKYINSFENKLRNLYAENQFKDVQKIIEQSKSTMASSRLPQHITSQDIYKTKPFESQNTFDNSFLSTPETPLSEISRNRINEASCPSVNQICTEPRRDNSFNNRKMDNNPVKFPRLQVQTTAKQIIPTHYHMDQNKKSMEETHEEATTQQHHDVNPKFIKGGESTNVHNLNENNKDTNNDILKSTFKAPVNGVNSRDYTPERRVTYNPSNIKPSVLCNENKNNVDNYNIRNAEGVFIQPNFARDKFENNELKNIEPQNIKSSINQVPRYHGDTMNTDVNGVLNKISEVNPSIFEPIIHPNPNPKKELNNSIKCYTLPTSTAVPHPINTQDTGKIYNSPINVQPSPIQVHPQQTAINFKSTPVVSATSYAMQTQNNEYEINKPKVTILNSTNTAQSPQGHQNPIVYYIPTYQQTGPPNAPKVHLLSQDYTNINPTISNAKGLANAGYQIHSPVNQFNTLLSASFNNIASVIVSNILSSLNKDISETLKKPLSAKLPLELPTFDVTHPCIESPRYLPDTVIRKDESSVSKSSKPCVSTITINVLPPVQQKSNDIIIVV